MAPSQGIRRAGRRTGRGQFPGAPRWVRNVALGIVGLIVVLVLLQTFPMWFASREICARCPAVRRVEHVLGLRVGWRPEPTPGSALFDRVEGACAKHAWTEPAWTAVCGRSSSPPYPGSSELFDRLANANTSNVPEVVHRMAQLSIPQRTDLFWRIVLRTGFDSSPSGDPRAWTAAMIDEQGWHDLERR